MRHPFDPAEFDAWIPAQQALARYRSAAGSHAAADLMKRLAEGVIAARAENFIAIFGLPKRYGPERLVPSYLWKAIAAQSGPEVLSLWSTGTVEVDIFPDGTDAAPVPHKLFGVRFDPAEIARLIPAPLPPGQEPPKRRSPPVPAVALKAWYQAYMLAYGAEERTADHAWACAKGAFPDRAVSRAEVRELLPPAKPGPKGRRAQHRHP